MAFASFRFCFSQGHGRDKAMSKLDETTAPHDRADRSANDEKPESALALRQREDEVVLKGLLVNSDEQVCQKLAETLGQCGLATVFASTVAESGTALAQHEVCIALCNDCLADGNYEDIVKLVGRSDTKVPVIVISKTGDWPDYLTAIRGGAFDYLPYPPIAGDLLRVIRNALLGYKRQRHLEDA